MPTTTGPQAPPPAAASDKGTWTPTTQPSITAGMTLPEDQALTGFAPQDQLGSVEPHVFSDPARAEYWRNVYDKVNYEGRSRFDPALTWTAETERRLKMKLDLRIMLWVWVMFSSLDLVRRNINRAVSDNMLDDLNINTNDYNTGQTVFFICFLGAELPGNLISKKFGPDRIIPICIILWGVACCAQSAMTGRASFLALRAIIGCLQGGFIPEMVLYLSYFYKGNELPIRLSVFYTAIPLTQIYGALLASGLLEMRGVRGWAGWQWLFLIEGLICIVIGFLSAGIMSTSIIQPALLFKRKDGSNKWWTEEEEKVLVNRLLRDDPTKGDMNNRQPVGPREVWKAISNVDMWPIYILGITAWIPFQPVANYLSLILRGMDYTVLESNLLAIPGYALFAINVLIAGWLSEKFKERSLVASLSNVWMLPFFIALVCIPDSSSPWVRYAMLTGINGIPYTHSILVGMTSSNAKNVGMRAVSTAIYNMCYQIGSIVAVNVYREEDKPYYHTANKALVGLCSANIALFVGMKVYYIWRNKVRQAKWDALPDSEKISGVDVKYLH
ncbi:major facilitator superfamily domain-containing protein [Aspergillus karnatakaensis]|uniref:major facilitator superfamily domain-containing protein n=1 Tax=Aspergillus karnatakaensis TaxID=1810916 RepID=UPI003CCCEA26